MGEKRCVELTEENQSGVIQGTCGTFKQKKKIQWTPTCCLTHFAHHSPPGQNRTPSN